MKASLHSVRIAPKKANLIAKMIRGMTVPQAIESLERTNKKAARLLEELLKSAMANAQNNDSQDPQELVIKSLIVNQGQAYHRGVPMARGRVRPMRKFLSHIELTLGIASVEGEKGKVKGESASKKTKEPTSQKSKKTVKKVSTQKESQDLEEGSSPTTRRSSGQEKKTTSTPKVSAEKDSSTKK
ncbi:50S ribosomal protein L22 [Patescibacteria group bacterium]|nr:50S ribosomal protein L22 [Patescibacteria group bacterium]